MNSADDKRIMQSGCDRKDNGGIVVVATGDIMLGREVGEKVLEHGCDFVIGNAVSVLRNSDVLFGNLECPISNRGKPISKAGPNFRASPKTVETLVTAGYDIVSLANNHIRDYGSEAVVDTIDILRRNGIQFVGAGKDINEANSEKILKIKDKRIAFLAFCDREESIATQDSPGAAEIKENLIIKKIEGIRGKVDYIVVSLHTGVEFSEYPSPFQIKICHRLIDHGADLVLGHHPHVPQGIEYYKNGLIAYSLGNFLFEMPVEKCKVGYVLKVIFGQNGIKETEVIPYKINEKTQVIILNNGEKRDVMRYLDEISLAIKDTLKIQAEWYKTARYLTRQSIKLLIIKTFGELKLWFPFLWIQGMLRPCWLRIWTSYLQFLIKGYSFKNKNLMIRRSENPSH